MLAMRLRANVCAVLFLTLISLVSGGCGPEQQRGFSKEPAIQCSGNALEHSEDVMLTVGADDSACGIYWASQGGSPHAGIVFVSGVDGGFVEPVDGIYQKIATELSRRGVASVFVQYRRPGEIDASLEDALQAAQHLRNLGVKKMALVGWSFGGAVITNAAVRIPETVTVIGFAPQAELTEPVRQFSKQSILLIHSHDDENVPFVSSEQILDEAPESTRKRLVELDGFDHLLTGAGETVEPIVMKWLLDEFSAW